MKNWQELGFRVEQTGDGSPSLRLIESISPDKDSGEAMHHSGGAYAETELIYGSLIKEVFDKIKDPQFCVVGLGLGYIELVIAREALLRQQNDVSIVSFESVPELREYFIEWLSSSGPKLPLEVKSVYDQVGEYVLTGTNLEIIQLKSCLQKSLGKSFEIKGALESDDQADCKVHCVLYDAFSSKTTPHLWDESFLMSFLTKTCHPDAGLATYAARGSLKRALQGSGFEVETRTGFQGKRNSTRGLRGIFKN